MDTFFEMEPELAEEKLDELEAGINKSKLSPDVKELFRLHFFKIRCAIIVAKNQLKTEYRPVHPVKEQRAYPTLPDPFFSFIQGK